MRTKGPPVIATNEWELLTKMRTSDEISRSALVDSLTVAGIERSQIATAQRTCPDLKAAYLGKLAKGLGRPVREALLEVQKEDKAAFDGKKLDAVMRSLEKFELIRGMLFRRVYNPVSNQVELRCVIKPGITRRVICQSLSTWEWTTGPAHPAPPPHLSRRHTGVEPVTNSCEKSS